MTKSENKCILNYGYSFVTLELQLNIYDYKLFTLTFWKNDRIQRYNVIQQYCHPLPLMKLKRKRRKMSPPPMMN